MATLDDRLKAEDYRHWVKAVLCLQYTKDGLVSLASNKSQDLHNAVLAQNRHSRNPSANGICSTGRIDFRRRAFTCCANCNAFLVETNKYCIGTLNLSNIDITHLHDQPWQLAKLFMNPGQDITNTIAGQTDLSGILNFFDHCKLAKAAILNTANISAVRDIRNMTLHTADMTITKHEFSMKIVPTLIALLQDPWFLSREQVAQEAVVKLNEVAAAGFHITKENEEKVLNDLTTELRCFSKDLNTKIDDLRTELNRVETNVSQEMKTQQEKLKQDLQDREKQTRQDMSTKIDDLQTDLNRVETNVGREMKTQQDKLEQELQDREKDKQWRQDLSMKIDDLQTELDRVETNVGLAMKTQQDKLEQDLQEREKDKQTLEKLVQTLEQKVEYDTELVTTFGTDVNTIKSSLEETRQGIDKLTLKIKLVEETCDRKHKHAETIYERKHRQLEEKWKGKHAEMAADIDDLNMRVTKTETVSITEDEQRLLFIGKTGHGKSATANSVLGYDRFKTSCLSRSETADLSYETAQRFDKKLVVVDTPGFFDTRTDEDEIRELVRCSALLSPGFHAILVVIKPDRFTGENKAAIQKYFNFCGSEASEYMFLILSHWDDIQREVQSFDDFFENGSEELKEIRNMCKGGAFPISNKGTDDEKNGQVQNIINKIDENVQRLRGKCFSHEVFTMIESYFSSALRSPMPVEGTIQSLSFRRYREEAAKSSSDEESVQGNREYLDKRDKLRRKIADEKKGQKAGIFAKLATNILCYYYRVSFTLKYGHLKYK